MIGEDDLTGARDGRRESADAPRTASARLQREEAAARRSRHRGSRRPSARTGTRSTGRSWRIDSAAACRHSSRASARRPRHGNAVRAEQPFRETVRAVPRRRSGAFARFVEQLHRRHTQRRPAWSGSRCVMSRTVTPTPGSRAFASADAATSVRRSLSVCSTARLMSSGATPRTHSIVAVSRERDVRRRDDRQPSAERHVRRRVGGGSSASQREVSGAASGSFGPVRARIATSVTTPVRGAAVAGSRDPGACHLEQR